MLNNEIKEDKVMNEQKKERGGVDREGSGAFGQRGFSVISHVNKGSFDTNGLLF